MKIHLVLILSILGGEWAHGTVQTSLNQDKPPYISIEKFNITLNGQDTASYIGGLDEFEQWGGGLTGGSASGSGSWMYQYYDNIYTPNGWGENYSWSWSSPTNYIQVWSAWASPSPSVSLTSTNGGAICAPQVVCDYYYYYTNGFEPMYGSFYFTLEESTTASASVTLHTGGRPMSRQRNVIALNGWGASQMVPDLYFNAEQFGAGSWCGYYGGGTNFPAQSVSLGSYGAPNANGTKYVILPDNTSVDVTPHVAGMPRYVFGIGSVQKYYSYFDLYVEQPNPGYSFMPIHDPFSDADFGHEFWGLRTDVPSDALQYISSGLTAYLGARGFYPGTNGSVCSSDPGQIQNDTGHSANVKRTFYIGFSDLLNALEYVRGISQAPPAYCWSGINCVALAVFTGEHAGVHVLPGDQSPQNFGAMLVQMYPGPFYDTNDVFYSFY